jgi:hypothetical protein
MARLVSLKSIAGKECPCRGCGASISKGEKCFDIPNPRTAFSNSRRFCRVCFDGVRGALSHVAGTHAGRETDRSSSSNPNVGAFVSHAKERLRNSLNALNVVNGGIDSLCAGRWLVSYLFVTANR